MQMGNRNPESRAQLKGRWEVKVIEGTTRRGESGPW